MKKKHRDITIDGVNIELDKQLEAKYSCSHATDEVHYANIQSLQEGLAVLRSHGHD